MAERSEAPTQSLTIYLAKSSHQSAASLLKNGALCTKRNVPITAAVRGELYIQPGSPKPPKWASLFDGLVSPGDFGKVSSAAALLIVPVDGRLAIVTFGHGRFLLAPDCWEERFGLRVALNSVDENKLRSIDKQTFDAIARHSREQAGREASAREFGIDVEQDLLRGVVGIPKKSSLGKRMYGMDALNVAVPASLEDLPSLLDQYVKKYSETGYRKVFPWVDQIAEVADGSVKENLDEELVERIRSGDRDRVWMAVPEIVSWDRIGGFRFGLRTSEPEHHDIALEAFLDAVGGASEISTNDLGMTIHCCDPEGVPFHHWTAYRCLYAEMDAGKESYVLTGGKWYRVTRDFLREVNEAYDRIPTCRWRLPVYDDASETAFNARVSLADPRFALMDENNIPYGGGHGSVEFCDLYTREKDIIHVKRYGSSALLSHLFAQGLVSGEAFQMDPEFRRQVDARLPSSHHLADPEKRPDSQEYHIVFAVISGDDSDLALPFFSRLNIKHADRRLRGYGYEVSKLKVDVADGRKKLKKFRKHGSSSRRRAAARAK